MIDDKEKIEKIIKQAAACIMFDYLPLSNEYVEMYKRKRLNDNKTLILKRGKKK